MSKQEQTEEELERRLRRGDNEVIRAFLRCAGEILLSQRKMPLLRSQLDAALVAMLACSNSALDDFEAQLADIISDTQDTPFRPPAGQVVGVPISCDLGMVCR